MKKNLWSLLAVCLVLALLAGCAALPENGTTPTENTSAETSLPTNENTEDPTDNTEAATEPPTEPSTEPSTEPPTEPSASAPTEDDNYEGDASTHYIRVVYAEQIRKYYTALTQQWNEVQYTAGGMSSLPTQYYEGNALNNVGFGFVDLNNDGYWELVIGAIRDAAKEPLAFEIWTLVNGKPVLLAQSDAQNRYYLQYSLEDNAWYVAKETKLSDKKYGTHYLMLQNDTFAVVQAVIYDAAGNPEAPWFMAYDTDMNTANDMQIGAQTAQSIMNANRKLYIATDYFPYSLYS